MHVASPLVAREEIDLIAVNALTDLDVAGPVTTSC